MKIIKTFGFNPSKGRLIRIKKIIDPIRNSIVKKAWTSKKSLRQNEDPFYQHLKFDALPQINGCKIRDRQHKN